MANPFRPPNLNSEQHQWVALARYWIVAARDDERQRILAGDAGDVDPVWFTAEGTQLRRWLALQLRGGFWR